MILFYSFPWPLIETPPIVEYKINNNQKISRLEQCRSQIKVLVRGRVSLGILVVDVFVELSYVFFRANKKSK